MAATVVSKVEVEGRIRWLTLDEVVAKLRFPTRRALFAHLRRHPAPVFQRVGSRRYFMKADDVDRMMAPIDLRSSVARNGDPSDTADAGPEEFVEVPAKVNGEKPRTTRSPRSRPPRSKTATAKR